MLNVVYCGANSHIMLILIKLYQIIKVIKSNDILSIMISKTFLSLHKHVYDSLCSHLFLFPLEFPVAYFFTKYLYTGIRRKKKEKTTIQGREFQESGYVFHMK